MTEPLEEAEPVELVEVDDLPTGRPPVCGDGDQADARPPEDD